MMREHLMIYQIEAQNANDEINMPPQSKLDRVDEHTISFSDAFVE